MNIFSERLDLLMKERGVKQLALSKATGISQGALSNYLSGRMPKTEELCRLADYFRVSVDSLLGVDFGGAETTPVKDFQIDIPMRVDKGKPRVALRMPPLKKSEVYLLTDGVPSGDSEQPSKEACQEHFENFLETCDTVAKIGWLYCELKERFPLEKFKPK